MKNNKGITLITLAVTIVILLILSGVTINLIIGKDGILEKAKYASKGYSNATENEVADLENLYSSIMVATGDNAKITITQENLNTLIKNEVKKAMKEMNTFNVRTDTYVTLVRTETSAYDEITSMEGFTETRDENNNIAQYLDYSDEKGYIVKKAGWYFIDTFNVVSASSGTSTELAVYINDVWYTSSKSWGGGGITNHEKMEFPIYLNERK